MSLATILKMTTAALATTTAIATTCKQVTDKDNQLIQFAMEMAEISQDQIDEIPKHDILENIKTMFPSFSQCVSNMDLIKVFGELNSNPNVTTCASAFESFDLSKYEDVTDAMFTDTICPFIMDEAMPCLHNLVLKTLTKLMESSGTCCNAFQNEVLEMMGASVETTIHDMAKMVTNILCSSRLYGKETELCGTSFSNTLLMTMAEIMLEDESMRTDHAMSVLQIPNDQFCNATNEIPFTTTIGQTYTYTKFPGTKRIGACYETVDVMTTHMSKYNIWKAALGMDMSNLWIDGKCLDGTQFVNALRKQSSLPMQILELLDALAELMNNEQKTTPAPTYPTDPNGSNDGKHDLSSNSHDFSQSASGSVSDNTNYFYHTNEFDDKSITNYSKIAEFQNFLNELEEFLNGKCLHLPNNVNCFLDTSEITYVYPELAKLPSPAPTPETSSPKPSTPEPTSSGNHDMTSITAITITISVILLTVF